MHPPDYSAPLRHLAQDPVMARLIAETPAPKVFNEYAGDRATGTPERDRVYLSLLESIVSQQISVKAADAIFARFRALFPDNYPQADALLLKTAEELRSAGLSFQKIKYLQSVAEFSLGKADPPHERAAHERAAHERAAHERAAHERAHLDTLTDEEVVQYLLPIKGVGRWTVEMLLMFVLDRPDVFPIDDLVIRQRMILAYPEQTNGLTGKALYRVLQEIAEPWRPYRTTASRYLWRWKPMGQ